MKQYRNSDQKANTGKNIGGKLITLIQLVLSIGLIIALWNSKMVPTGYLAVCAVLFLVLFLAAFGLQYVKSKVKFVGIVFSVLVSIVLVVGLVYFMKADQMMQEVGGATYKTDNMVVAVKKGNSAENLMEARNYRFGYQTSVDQENNSLMLDDVQAIVGRDIKLVEYETVVEEAQALLDGRVEAAIYNEAFTGIIDDAIEGYSDEVRILYQYGIDTEIEQEETTVEEPFNVYISGIDVSGPITTNSRSDVNIIMTVNPKTKKILLTTTPRDYYVQIPEVSGEARDKLTHAGIYGVDASMRTLESLYGIDISYYARVNFTSLIAIVDALGGIEVNSEYAFTTTHGKFEIQQGINHMDGETALGFSRERYSFEDGDNQRGKNQEAVLTAILQKAMSPVILKNANQMIASVSDCVETNMTKDEMSKFINMQLSDGTGWSIESQAAAGRGDNQACFSSGTQLLYVMWPDDAFVAECSRRIQGVLDE